MGGGVLTFGAALLVAAYFVRSSSPGAGSPELRERTPRTSGRKVDKSQAFAARALVSTASGPREASGESPRPPASVVSGDPRISGLISEQSATQTLWQHLNNLLELKGSLDAVDYREAVMSQTCRFLGFNAEGARAFEFGISQALGELAYWQKTMREGIAALPEDLTDYHREAGTHEIIDQYQARKRVIVSRIAALMDQTDRARRFQEHIETWMGYLGPL